jgi:hypothetical protein
MLSASRSLPSEQLPPTPEPIREIYTLGGRLISDAPLRNHGLRCARCAEVVRSRSLDRWRARPIHRRRDRLARPRSTSRAFDFEHECVRTAGTSASLTIADEA